MKKTALITGATQGIGYELAKQFAEHAYDLVIVSRNKEDLQRVSKELTREYGVQVWTIASDLSLQESPDKILSFLKSKKIGIEVLVNNAGFGLFGRFSETDLEKELNMIHLNVMSLTHLTKLLLPGMIKKKFGYILNVASTASFMPGPLSAVYFASKAYVLSFSEAIAQELQSTGVQVSALCPGPTKTGFGSRSGGDNTGLFASNALAQTAQDVAAIAYRDLMRGKRIIIPGWRNKVQIFLLRFAPRSLVTSIVRSFIEK
jgi:short-subunit dehydrogenase